MARAPFVSQAARAAGVTTEAGYTRWLHERRVEALPRTQRADVRQRLREGKLSLSGIGRMLMREQREGKEKAGTQAWRNRPHGALARLLEYMGYREKGAEYAVGETPETRREAA